MSFIEVKNLTHLYTTKNENGDIIAEKRALDHVNFTVDDGEFVAILGASGSGKTTLARHLNALLFPMEGSIRIDGKSTEDENQLYEIRSKVGMVFQNPDNQMVAQMLEDEVAFGPENLGLSSEEIRSRVDGALEAVGLAEQKNFMVQYLSGGQKQLAAIAGVLAMQPKCIVLDEATSMLDPQGRREVLKAVGKLRREKDVAIVMITHDVEETLFADRICVMNRGRIVMSGKPNDIFQEEEEVKKYGLELPQVLEIARELRGRGLSISPGVITEEELERELFCLCHAGCTEFHTGEMSAIHMIDKKIEDTEELPGIEEKNGSAEENAKAEPENISRQHQMDADLEMRKHGREVMSLHHVTKKYFTGSKMQIAALKDVSFSVHSGEFVAVIGQTGSGKSTLLELLGGLVKPEEGTVKVSGRDDSTNSETKIGMKHGMKRGTKAVKKNRTEVMTKDGTKAVAEKEMENATKTGTNVGIVFQYPDHQLFEETVMEDVMFGPKNLGIQTVQAESLARQALQAVNLPEEIWERSPLTLSGGEKRKAALAGVLAMEPEILLLDEPAAGLSQADRSALFRLLREEYQEKGRTVLFTTHHMEDVAEFADRVIVLHQGTVVFDGAPKEVFRHEGELREIGLDVPLRIRLEKEFQGFLSEPL